MCDFHGSSWIHGLHKSCKGLAGRSPMCLHVLGFPGIMGHLPGAIPTSHSGRSASQLPVEMSKVQQPRGPGAQPVARSICHSHRHLEVDRTWRGQAVIFDFFSSVHAPFMLRTDRKVQSCCNISRLRLLVLICQYNSITFYNYRLYLYI